MSGQRGGTADDAASTAAAAPSSAAQRQHPAAEGDAEECWDVVIVGSGLGGLSAASTLAQTRGLRCLVVEQHWTPGGMTHQFERAGKYWFSSGTHYVGQLGEGNLLSKMMGFVTKGMLWDKLPEEFEASLFPDGAAYRQPADAAEWRARLVRQFPAERRAIERYFADIEKVYRWYMLHFLQQAVGRPLSTLLYWLGSWGRRHYEQLSAQEYFDTHFKSEELKGVLLAFWGDYGLRPDDVTFMQHALSVRNNFGGCYHPRLGSRQVARCVTPIIEAAGGRVMTSTWVKEIVVEGGTAVGVRLQQQGRPERFVRARLAVISACGAHLTFRRLLAQPLFSELDSRRLVNAGYAAIVLYVGLKGDPQELWGLQGETLRLCSTYRHAATPLYSPEEGEVGHVILCPTSQRELRARAHCMDIFTFTSPDHFRRWEGSAWGGRGAEYERVKAKIAEDVLAFIGRWLPGFQDQVEFIEVGTPLTWEKFTAWKEGTIYGVPSTGDKLRHAHIFKPPTPIKQLFLAGCDANVFGIMGAMMGGVMAAAHLLYPRAGLLGLVPEVHRVMAAPGWDNILSLPPEAAAATLVEVTDETADTRTLTFELPPAAVERFAFREGQYATLVMDIHRSEVRRPYSISSCPSQLPRLSITVKRLPGGMASTHLHTLAPGAVVHLLPPAGDFVLQPLPSPAGIHLFFAAGSGIAPTLPMLRAALAGGEAGALLYCSRRQGEVIFSAQLQQLQQEQRAAGSAAGLLAVQHCLSKGAAVSPQQVPDVAGSLQEGVKCQGGSGARVCVLADASSHPVPPEPAAGSAHMPDEDWHGRLTPARVQSFLNSVLARASSAAGPPAAAGDSVQCYMCGPLDWMNMIRDALQAAGVPPCGIHAEDFASDSAPLAVDYAAAGVAPAARSVRITTASGAERAVTVAAHQSVLSAALNEGVAVPYSCRTGSCASCAARLTCGAVLDIEDGLVAAAGQAVLTCRVAPASDDVALQL